MVENATSICAGWRDVVRFELFFDLYNANWLAVVGNGLDDLLLYDLRNSNYSSILTGDELRCIHQEGKTYHHGVRKDWGKTRHCTIVDPKVHEARYVPERAEELY